MYKHICLGFACVVVLVFGWMLNDFRRDLKQSARTLNEKLPVILENTKSSTETLKDLSKDIRALRDLAGVSNETRDRSLVTYADELLDLVEASGAEIGLKKKLIGSGLKEVVPADEWTTGARKEALWLSFRAKSKRELLERMTKNRFGSDWYIVVGDESPQKLADWLREHHDETAQMTGHS